MKFFLTLVAIIVPLVQIAFGQALDLRGMADTGKPKGLDVSGTAVQTGAAQMMQQLEKLREAQKEASKQLQRLQYVPIDGVINGEKYFLGPNDVIRIQAWGATTIDETAVVTPDGMIVLPGYGAVAVGGLCWNEAKAKIESASKEAYNPQKCAITLAGVRIFHAHVSGSVYFPGSYEVGATQRIWDIMQFGMTSPLADLTNIKVIHRNGDTDIVDITPYLAEGKIDANPYLRDGDVVLVQAVQGKEGMVRLYGAGVRSGYYGLFPGETAKSLAQRSGILSKSPDLSNVRILRGDDVISISLLKQDMPLMDKDIVIFPTHIDSIFVGGIVTTGGAFPYYAGVSYHSYVAMAGGPAEKGSEGRVSIYRNGKKYSPKEAGDLLPGDVIIVHHSLYDRIRDFTEMVARVVSSGLTVYYLIDRLTQ